MPARAGEDYESLREQLFGVERLGATASGFGVLLRCGLAAWAMRRRDPASLSYLPQSAPAPASQGSAAPLLVKLIANLILDPRQEASPCRA